MAWLDETASVTDVTPGTSITGSTRTVAQMLAEIISTANLGVAALNAAIVKATMCQASMGGRHAQHGTDMAAKVLNVRRALEQIRRGVVIAALDQGSAPIGCIQELDHPGGGDIDSVGRPRKYRRGKKGAK